LEKKMIDEPEDELEETEDVSEAEEENKVDAISEEDESEFKLPSDDEVMPTTFDSFEADDFGFIEHFGEEISIQHEEQLPENEAQSALNCAFIGIGGGGGKLAKAFLDLGFNKTLLINTTEKDQPEGVEPAHLILIPDADGVAKNVTFGKQVFNENSAVVEDAIRTKLGKVDWLFVLAGGGGGTGSSCVELHEVFERYLSSVQAEGKVVYIISWPTAQESLNPTISKNALILANDVAPYPHLLIDNERQVQLLRGKVGILNMYPVANSTFAKLFHQVLKLASEKSFVQTFDSKDLGRCLSTEGRMFLGSTMIANPSDPKLGAAIFQNCIKRSPCPMPKGKSITGTMLLIITPEMATDPEISKHLDAAMSYVGGRCETLFSGVYIKENLPGLVAILSVNGMDGR
jgi:cell division GTPase FtsZ